MNLITLKLVLIISFPKFEINNRGTYYTSNNKSKHIDTEKENYFEIKCIFNEKNDYLVKICAKDINSNILAYKVHCVDNSKIK